MTQITADWGSAADGKVWSRGSSFIWRVIWLMWVPAVLGWEAGLPPRAADCVGGAAFARSVAGLGLVEREREVARQVELGNVPDFWRRFVKVAWDGVVYWVAPEYFAIGSDEDYFLCPLSPMAARSIGERLGCSLPSPGLVDAIYVQAAVRLTPEPIPPSPEMTNVSVFLKHNEMVRSQRAEFAAPLGALVAGHKKDVVGSDKAGKVAIYGWHRGLGDPIQPLYSGHSESWVDYSHGVRFVRRCDEARFEPGVRVVFDEPEVWLAKAPTRLVLYALPNGSSIEETMGRRPRSTNEWRHDIQHIGAQTRWLRERMKDANLVVAYLECAEKAWPAWRRKHDPDNKKIPKLVERLRDRYTNAPVRMVLTGHSGGGSFTFGYLNGVAEIPGAVERIAFLDSNYAYQDQGGKLARWLTGAEDRHLCVLAYHDSIALLEGKTFVSERGGTWGRSQAMIEDLSEWMRFERRNDADWQRASALGGRVQFFLKENPAKAILHTRQVEWNGFIHAMLVGTALEGQGYEYFGARVYERLIRDPSLWTD